MTPNWQKLLDAAKEIKDGRYGAMFPGLLKALRDVDDERTKNEQDRNEILAPHMEKYHHATRRELEGSIINVVNQEWGNRFDSHERKIDALQDKESKTDSYMERLFEITARLESDLAAVEKAIKESNAQRHVMRKDLDQLRLDQTATALRVGEMERGEAEKISATESTIKGLMARMDALKKPDGPIADMQIELRRNSHNLDALKATVEGMPDDLWVAMIDASCEGLTKDLAAANETMKSLKADVRAHTLQLSRLLDNMLDQTPKKAHGETINELVERLGKVEGSTREMDCDITNNTEAIDWQVKRLDEPIEDIKGLKAKVNMLEVRSANDEWIRDFLKPKKHEHEVGDDELSRLERDVVEAVREAAENEEWVAPARLFETINALDAHIAETKTEEGEAL